MSFQTKKVTCEWEIKDHYDLIVVGAGPAGIGAAVSAGRRGLRVALVETFGFPGGVGTQSCCPMYYGFGVEGKQVTAGLSDEFVRRMDSLGAASLFLQNPIEMPEYRPIGDRELTNIIIFDQETMKVMYNKMLLEAGVDCYFYTQLSEVVTENGHIHSVLLAGFEGTYLLEADTFIDATGNAQLAFLADRDSVKKCSEEFGLHNSLFFIVDGVTPFDIEEAKRVYWEAKQAGKLPEMVWNHFGFCHMLKPGAVQLAVCFEIGDGADSREMTAMDQKMRDRMMIVLDFFKKEMPGFKNCYISSTPVKVGVRTSRNIVSKYDFSKELLMSDDYYHPVALCRRRYGAHTNSKNSFISSWKSTATGIGAVPMEALISARFDNLLAAGRCIGSDPMLIGTFRMMNTCMTMGEAAGLMAHVAKKKGKTVNLVDYEELLPLLKENKFILKA